MNKYIVLSILAALGASTTFANSKRTCGENGKVSEATLITIVKPIAVFGFIPLDSTSIANKSSITKNKPTNPKLKQNTATDSSTVKKNCKSNTCKVYCPVPKKEDQSLLNEKTKEFKFF